MARRPMKEDDPLVPQQVSLFLSLRNKLKKAAVVSGKSEAQIVRDALAVELEKDDYKGD